MTRRAKCHDTFDHSVKTTLGFALATQIDHIPDRPGLYAWYVPLKGDDSSSLLNFLSQLHDTFSTYAGLSEMSAESAQKKITISRNTPAFQPSQSEESLSAELTNETVQIISALMLTLSFFSEPVYVGMTFQRGGLRARLRSHLQSPETLFEQDRNWTGGFRSRAARTLRQADGLRNCLIAYAVIPDHLPLNDKRIVRLLERHLIRFIRPPQNKRS
jgi:hypothetical protein